MEKGTLVWVEPKDDVDRSYVHQHGHLWVVNPFEGEADDDLDMNKLNIDGDILIWCKAVKTGYEYPWFEHEMQPHGGEIDENMS